MKNNNYNNEENAKPENNFQVFLAEKLKKNPVRVFKAMILILGISVVGSVIYSVFKKPYVRPQLELKSNIGESSLSNSFGELVNAGNSFIEIKDLDARIKKILAKKTLTKQDSVQLLNHLTNLQEIHKRLIPK